MLHQKQIDITSVRELYLALKSFLTDDVGMQVREQLAVGDVVFDDGVSTLLRLKMVKSSPVLASIGWGMGSDLDSVCMGEIDTESMFPFQLSEGSIHASFSWFESVPMISVHLVGDFPKVYLAEINFKTLKSSVSHRNHLVPEGGEFMKCGA